MDADWATNGEDRRSVSGCVVLLCGMAVHTHSRTQNAVALSSCESELYALAGGGAELIFVKTWLEEQGLHVSRATVWSDSSSAICVAYKRGPGTKLKHVALRSLVVQDWVRQRRFTVAKVATESNGSDFLTKSVASRSLVVGCTTTQVGPG